ncbi:unnamed protein product, partial [Cylicostephanus goldi]
MNARSFRFPPSTCPTLEERTINAKIENSEDEKPLQRAKDKPFPVDDVLARSSKETGPPSAQPVADTKQDANATLGSIYFGYGYDSTRNRRELSEPRVSTNKGYPEVDLVGELRVLDSPEDVMYFGK